MAFTGTRRKAPRWQLTREIYLNGALHATGPAYARGCRPQTCLCEILCTANPSHLHVSCGAVDMQPDQLVLWSSCAQQQSICSLISCGSGCSCRWGHVVRWAARLMNQPVLVQEAGFIEPSFGSSSFELRQATAPAPGSCWRLLLLSS